MGCLRGWWVVGDDGYGSYAVFQQNIVGRGA
jgi:hypothetical protein